MPAFENNILGFVRPQDWLDVGFEVTRPNDPVDSLFGDQRTDNMVATWQSIAAEYQIPMMAQFHAFDTEAQQTFRVPVDNHSIEKGLIKVKINQSERMRDLIKQGVQGDQAMYDYVISDGARLADQVVTRSKVAKNELMATGKVTIKENNLDLTVDYGVPEDQLNLKLDLSAESDVLEQLLKISDDASARGVTLNGMLTSRSMLTKLRSHPSVQGTVLGNVGIGRLVRMDELENLLSSEFGIERVVTNDLSYGISDGIIQGAPKVKSHRYYPLNTISFFATNPGGKMGVGLWGDPPEATSPRTENVSQSAQSPYVYIKQWVTDDPDVVWTKASGLFMPVLYNPSSLWIAKTTGEA